MADTSGVQQVLLQALADSHAIAASLRRELAAANARIAELTSEHVSNEAPSAS